MFQHLISCNMMFWLKYMKKIRPHKNNIVGKMRNLQTPWEYLGEPHGSWYPSLSYNLRVISVCCYQKGLYQSNLVMSIQRYGHLFHRLFEIVKLFHKIYSHISFINLLCKFESTIEIQNQESRWWNRICLRKLSLRTMIPLRLEEFKQ